MQIGRLASLEEIRDRTESFRVVVFAGSSNLVGKFTQSVRRIVQDVKDEGTASGQTKEEVIETNERLRAVRIRLDESYDTAKKALVTLMAKYNDSKSVHNIFQRYNLLKLMIKVSGIKGCACPSGSILSRMISRAFRIA